MGPHWYNIPKTKVKYKTPIYEVYNYNIVLWSLEYTVLYKVKYDSPVVDGFGAVGVVVASPGGEAHNWGIVNEIIAGDDGVDGIGDDMETPLKQRARRLICKVKTKVKTKFS